MKKLALTVSIIVFSFVGATAQVSNTSFVSKTGEKVLQLSIVVPVDKATAWSLFTTDNNLSRWMAPVAHIELKSGGYILTNYNKARPLTDSSSIRLGIINYIDNELLTLKVNLNANFPPSVRNEDANLQEVLQFIDLGNGKTKIVSSMLGWGKGEGWDKTYTFFEKGNEWTFKELLKLFSN